jgi:hypothetical protein
MLQVMISEEPGREWARIWRNSHNQTLTVEKRMGHLIYQWRTETGLLEV